MLEALRLAHAKEVEGLKAALARADFESAEQGKVHAELLQLVKEMQANEGKLVGELQVRKCICAYRYGCHCKARYRPGLG